MPAGNSETGRSKPGPKPKAKLDLSVRGSTGLPVSSGRVYDEILLDLQGERGRRVLREMSEQDAIVGGVLLGIEMLARQVPWNIKPAISDQEDPKYEKAKEVADFIDECLTDMYPSWDSAISEALSMLVYGWSWLEIIYKRRSGLMVDDPLRSSRFDDGKIGWAGWSIRSQETLHTWEYSERDKGQVVGMTQLGPPDWRQATIPRAKSLHFTTRSRRENPEGVSILRNAYRAWYMKKNIEVIEGIGIERDLAGLPVMRAPAELFGQSATPEQKALLAHLQDIVTSIKRDEQEGVLLPQAFTDDGKNPLYVLELLSTGGERQFDTNAIIGRYDERIAMSMLADFILMGHSAVGSFALSTTKTGLFSTALGSILDGIGAEINQNAIPRLVQLNGYPLDMSPTAMHGQVEASDMGKLGEFLKMLADAGMQVFPNPELEKHVMQVAGLPMDPGAGELPLIEDVDEAGNPILRPAGGQLLPPTVGPGLPRITGRAPLKPPKPAPTTKPGAPTKPVAKAASERKGQRFINLSTRVFKAADVLQRQLGEEAYNEFLLRASKAQKFSLLSAEDRAVLLEAEE